MISVTVLVEKHDAGNSRQMATRLLIETWRLFGIPLYRVERLLEIV